MESIDLQVALVGAAAVVLTAVIAALGTVLSARRTRERIGDPNGHGSIVGMLTEVLNGQAGQDRRIAHLEADSFAMRQELAQVVGRVDVIEKAAIRPPAT
jgi:hypothetical protein